MRAKKGKLYQRFLEIEARKEEILAIWEKTGHELSATAKQAGLSTSTLLGKFRQWGIKTRAQEESARVSELREEHLGAGQPHHLKVEARKEEILAIWEKTGHKFLATARKAKVSNSELSRKLKEWGIKTPAQEARIVADRERQERERLLKQSIVPEVEKVAQCPELLAILLKHMPSPGDNPGAVKRWKSAWDAAFDILYIPEK